MSDATRDDLRKIAATLCCRVGLTDSFAGVVVAGFGDKEHLPALRSAQVVIRVLDRLKYQSEDQVTITTEENAVIVPFAQVDVVDLFMRGVDPRYDAMVAGFVQQVVGECPTEVLRTLPGLSDDHRREITERWASVGPGLVQAFRERLHATIDRHWVQPIMNVVAILPKNELAALAEALVSLTSLKRKVSLDAETVGGPIDVAVISKGDGLVWIQRKHYFKPELNHQFFANYFPRTADLEESDVRRGD